MISQSKTIEANKAVLEHYNESLAEQKQVEQAINEEESLVGTDEYVEEIARDTERDNFMTSKQALEYGLIDKIYDKRA
jgi:ATP-dependent protease ClpP protease subunit